MMGTFSDLRGLLVTLMPSFVTNSADNPTLTNTKNPLLTPTLTGDDLFINFKILRCLPFGLRIHLIMRVLRLLFLYSLIDVLIR